jgi:hypothetical protein
MDLDRITIQATMNSLLGLVQVECQFERASSHLFGKIAEHDRQASVVKTLMSAFGGKADIAAPSTRPLAMPLY